VSFTEFQVTHFRYNIIAEKRFLDKLIQDESTDKVDSALAENQKHGTRHLHFIKGPKKAS
jgi:hypothetical protein